MTYDTTCDVESSSGIKVSARNEVSSDIYANATVTKKPEPKIADQSLPNIDKAIGFNPYDTGVLQQQKLKS